jgi:NAD(P)-dependent dehydrogenase (short-subunit alcohol dehydrogenase family)
LAAEGRLQRDEAVIKMARVQGCGASEGKVVTLGATSPLGRAGQPAELAGIYVRLAEDDGSYTTGNIYGAGGGQGQP